MNTNLLRTLCVLFVALSGFGACAEELWLKKTFESISKIEGFQMMEYTAEEYGFPKEMGEMKMTCYRNSEPREKVLGILFEVPDELMKVDYKDERDKITRVYVEKGSGGEAVLMQVFIGKEGNDLCVWLFKGASLEYYQKMAQQMNEELKSR